MKGLLLKDYIYVRRLYLKVILLMFAFYLLLSVFSGAGRGEGQDYSMAGALAALFSIFPVATFSVDYASHWDRYALSGPIDRRMLVLSKYIFSGLSVLAGALFSLAYIAALSLFTGALDAAAMKEALGSLSGFLLAGVFFNSVMIPCIYRFGPEKARMLVFVVVAIPFIVGILGRVLHLQAPSAEQVKTLLYVLPVLALVGVYLSYRLSLHIYRKQEIS